MLNFAFDRSPVLQALADQPLPCFSHWTSSPPQYYLSLLQKPWNEEMTHKEELKTTIRPCVLLKSMSLVCATHTSFLSFFPQLSLPFLLRKKREATRMSSSRTHTTTAITTEVEPPCCLSAEENQQQEKLLVNGEREEEFWRDRKKMWHTEGERVC